jgi:uncharacterized protein (DUF488 family)
VTVSGPALVLLSIGHSNHPIELFLDLLGRHGIGEVADVRSRPYSRFVPHYSKGPLEQRLRAEGIGYRYFGAELGGKPVRGEAPPSAMDYASRVAEPGFRAGIERLLAAAREQRTALLCRERDPLDCHRFHLICRYLGPLGPKIRHILPSGALEPQDATERRLLERARPEELPLFGRDDALAQAYDRWWQRAR